MSLTIQAPHANMNGYEIGNDETRKNGVSDKGTIYAGDLQFAQTTGNAVSDKKQSAQKQAMKLILFNPTVSVFELVDEPSNLAFDQRRNRVRTGRRKRRTQLFNILNLRQQILDDTRIPLCKIPDSIGQFRFRRRRYAVLNQHTNFMCIKP